MAKVTIVRPPLLVPIVVRLRTADAADRAGVPRGEPAPCRPYRADRAADRHGVVKKYYDDLFAGRLGFDLIKTFKVYPSLLGVTIDDDRAELSSRMNDHPRVYIFKRHHA